MIPAATILPEGSYHPHPRQGAIQTGVEEATKRFKKYTPYVFSSYMNGKPEEESVDGVLQYRIKTGSMEKLLFPLYAMRSPYYCYAYKVAQTIKKLHEHNQNIADTLSQKEANEVLASIDAYVAVSRFTYNFEITERYPRYKDKASVILNGVNLDKFRPIWEQQEKAFSLRKKYGLEGSKVILFSGALRERKGIHFLIDAFKQVAAKHTDAKLVIAGGDKDNLEATDKYAKQLKDSAASLGNKVVFTGFVPPSEVSDIYLLGDIFCGPSLWDEAFGLVFAEASASGLAVIGSKRGGIPEIIKDGQTGLLINKPEDPSEIAQKIISFIDSPQDRQKFGEAARRYMEEKFSWDRVANDIESLYDRLLK